MDAARLLYGELEIEAGDAISSVDKLDSLFDMLASTLGDTIKSIQSVVESISKAAPPIAEVKDEINATTKKVGMFDEQIKNSEGFMKSFYETLDEISKINAIDVFMFFASIIPIYFYKETKILSATQLL